MNNRRLEKKIIMSNGTVKYATVEEVIFNDFSKAISAFAKKSLNGLAWTMNNHDFEDYEQIARMEIMKMFDVYDEVHSFSAMVNTRLDQLYTYLLRYYGNLKRSMNNKEDRKENRISYTAVELDGDYCENYTMAEVIGDLDDLIADTEINLAIKECANDLSDNDKRILAFLINQNEAKIDFAKRIGISRPTLDKKINLIRQMLKEKIYVA